MVNETLSEAVLQSLLDKHPDPITYHTPLLSADGDVVDFILVYCNECQRKQANLPVDEMIGKKVSQLYGYSEEGRQLLLKQLTEVWTTGNDVENTYHNEVLDIFFRVHRKKVEGGVLTVAKNVNTEVHERQEKERLNELSNQVLDTSLDGWFICEMVYDQQGEIIDFVFSRINKGFTQITGLLENDVLGKSYLAKFPSAKEQGSFDLNVRVFKTGKPERLQMPYHGDGLNAWFEVAVSKLGQNYILVTFADITQQVNNLEELKRTNDLLNGILSNSASGIAFGSVIRNEEGKIVDGQSIIANDAAIRYAGIPRELFLSKTAAELEPNIRESLYFQKVIYTMETGEPSNVQYKVESSGKWVEIALSRMDDDHLIIVYSDITESKEVQLRQELLLEELRRSNESLEDFTSAASHDLKEPIRKVHFFTERLKEKLQERLSSEERKLLERVENATARMRLLVDDLLEYSHVSRGNQEVEDVDMNQKVQLIQTDLELMMAEKEATINVGTLPVVRGYRRQLQQLLHNLLHNALKYSKPGVPVVVNIASQTATGKETGVSVRPEDQDKTFYVVEISDNGIGFEQEYAEKIFNIFTRLHGNTEYTGTGVGLAIVKKVVDNHDGYIAAESSPGNGATFKLLLPA